MKFKIITLSLIAIAASMTANAQLLWKVTPKSGAPVSYIFGTYHLAPVSVLDSVAGFNDALASVDKVYGELDMSKVMQSENMAIMRDAVLAPADSTLDKILTPVQLDSLTMVLQKYAGDAVNATMLNPLKPVAVATQLLILASTKIPGVTPGEALDAAIQNRAAAAGKEIGGLEDLAFQVKLLYGQPLKKQAVSLMSTVREILDGNRIADMYNAYRAGKLDEILSGESLANMTDEEAETLIYSRNYAWVEFLLGALPTASIMIAVGGAHLPGDRGLIKQLRDHGYTVEPSMPQK